MRIAFRNEILLISSSFQNQNLQVKNGWVDIKSYLVSSYGAVCFFGFYILFLLLSGKQVEETSSYRIRTTFQLRSRVLYSPWNEASDMSETLDFYWLNHTSTAILGSWCPSSPVIDTDFVTTQDKSTFWDHWGYVGIRPEHCLSLRCLTQPRCRVVLLGARFFLTSLPRRVQDHSQLVCSILQPPSPMFAHDGSYYLTLASSPQGEHGDFIHLAKVKVPVSLKTVWNIEIKKNTNIRHVSPYRF